MSETLTLSLWETVSESERLTLSDTLVFRDVRDTEFFAEDMEAHFNELLASADCHYYEL